MIRPAIIGATIALLLSGCAAMPHLAPGVTSLHSDQLGLTARLAPVDARWWETFDDPQLDRLVQAACSSSPTLESALARLRGAQAGIDVAHAAQLPQVGADFDPESQRFSNKYLIPPPYAGTTRFTSSLQANLSWDLDLFGRQRAHVRQARSDAEAAALDVAEARLALITGLVQTYIGLAQAERQIDVADAFVATRADALTYIQSRIRNDLASDFDQRAAETLLAEAQQAKVRAQRQRDLLVHALATLSGHGADYYPSIDRPALAFDKPITVPNVLAADLLGRRPDLLAAEARIQAAISGRTAAAADFLPDINLQGLVGLSSIGFGNIFAAASGTTGIGAAIHVPIFEGGRLRAQYRTATADLDNAVADYNGLVLRAVQQTADALTSVRSSDDDLTQQIRVVSGLRATVRLNKVRLSTGLGSNLDAVDSGFRLLEAEQSLINLQAGALNYRVQLIAALGGGFDPARPL